MTKIILSVAREKKVVLVVDRIMLPEQGICTFVWGIVLLTHGTSTSASPSPNRITAFQDTWPKLETWFSRKQGVLVKVDAEVEEEALFKKVESTIYQAVERKAEKGSLHLPPKLSNYI